jgi:hypothetical protein
LQKKYAASRGASIYAALSIAGLPGRAEPCLMFEYGSGNTNKFREINELGSLQRAYSQIYPLLMCISSAMLRKPRGKAAKKCRTRGLHEA